MRFEAAMPQTFPAVIRTFHDCLEECAVISISAANRSPSR